MRKIKVTFTTDKYLLDILKDRISRDRVRSNLNISKSAYITMVLKDYLREEIKQITGQEEFNF